MTKVAIIGAGLSGICAAFLLKNHVDITLFEKAHSVGGRMSTRCAKPYFFDHGAQYFTARTEVFQKFIRPLCDLGVIKRWDASYAKLKSNEIIERRNGYEQEPRYVGVPGMNRVCKFLAEGMNIHTNTRIVKLTKSDTWGLTDSEGREQTGFNWVICTIPPPQTTAILPQSFRYYFDLKTIKMRACIALMLGFKQAFPLKFECAHINQSSLRWIAINSSKPGRPSPFTLVGHSSESYAKTHMKDHSEKILQQLMSEACHLIGQKLTHADYQEVHRWHYASALENKKKWPAFIDQDLKLAACGDWCLGARVENAFTSAYQLAQHLIGYNL